MFLRNYLRAAFAAAALVGTVSAIKLDIDDEQSIKDAAAIAAFNTMSNYTSNHTGNPPGAMPDKWWEGGMLFDTMIQYWHFTGDESNNDAIRQGMYWQAGQNDDYMPANYSAFISNDDQAVWAQAAMTAAELGFPQDSTMPAWITLAENVWNTQVRRWDTSSCAGGLRSALYPYMADWESKSAGANGLLFGLSARLARYTNNRTYADWAEKVWDWSVDAEFLDTETWKIVDSADVESDCESRGLTPWTYNYGPYISGAAYMYNVTSGKESKWQSGLDGLLNQTFRSFFPEKYGGKIMSQFSCESSGACTDTHDIMKALFASDLTFVTLVAPYTVSDIIPRLKASAVGAAKQCTGGSNHTLCGRRWYQPKWDGTASMEEQISATSIFTSNLVVYNGKVPITATTTSNDTGSSTTSSSGPGTGTASAGVETSTDNPNGASAPRESLGVAAGIVAGVVAVVQAVA